MTKQTNDNYTVKTFKLKFTQADYAVNLVKRNGAMCPSMKYNRMYAAIADVLPSKGVFTTDGRQIVYAEGRFYENVEGAFRKIVEDAESVSPTVLSVTDGGENRLLILTETKSLLVGEKTTVVKIPYGKYACVCDERLFIANGNEIVYGEPFNYGKISVSDQIGGKIVVNGFGNICGLWSASNGVYVFLEKAIFLLTTSEDFSLKKLNVGGRTITDGTVRGYGDKAFFMSEGEVCVFDGKKIKTEDFGFNKECVKLGNEVSAKDGIYCVSCTVNDDGEKYVYCRDVDLQEEFITERVGFLFDYGGYAMEEYAYLPPVSRLCKLSSTRVYKESFRAGFVKRGLPGVGCKTITGVSANIEGDAYLDVTGDFGTTTFYVGKRSSGCKLRSRGFGFEFTDTNKFKRAEDLTISYTDEED